MGKIEFDYDGWNVIRDIKPERPGNTLGYAAILTGMEIGDTQTVRGRQREVLLRETEAGVIGLLFGAIEWLRWRGYSAEAVQSKVLACKRRNYDDQRQKRLQEVQENVEEPSNPRRLKLSESVVIP